MVLDPPAGPKPPILYLLSKLVDSDFSVSHEPQVAVAVERGRPITAVASLIPKPTAALIWLKKSGIKGVADLRGKTIAIPGLSFQAAFLKNILAGAGLESGDVGISYTGFDAVPALVDGRADAILVDSASLEGVELESLGHETVVTPLQGLGIPPYDELVLLATTEFASKEPQLIRDLLAALSRGTAAAVKDPRAVVREIEGHVEPSPVSSRQAREAQVAATLPLLSKTGYLDPAQGKNLIDWMQKEGMLQGKLPVSALLTNEFLSQP